MEARHVYQQQVEALRADLVLAQACLRTKFIREDLIGKIQHLFGNLIAGQAQKLKTLGKDAGDGGDLSDCWQRLEDVERDCDRILRELLAFVEGGLVRSAKLDQGICDIADRLLIRLAAKAGVEWPRFTIMAEDERFADLSDVIRIRFPHFSIWNLPVAVHELGHFVASKLTDRLQGIEPFARLQAEIGKKKAAGVVRALGTGAAEEQATRARRHLDEYFADLFAAHALGPAWAYVSVLLRFNPRRAYVSSPSHPCDDWRVHLVLAGLERMDFGPAAARLRKIWRESVVAAGNTDPRDTHLDQKQELEAYVDRLLSLMPVEAGYREWAKPYDLAIALLSRGWRQAAEGAFVRDVLNAAWICRMKDPSRTDAIGERALVLCRELEVDAQEKVRIRS